MTPVRVVAVELLQTPDRHERLAVLLDEVFRRSGGTVHGIAVGDPRIRARLDPHDASAYFSLVPLDARGARLLSAGLVAPVALYSDTELSAKEIATLMQDSAASFERPVVTDTQVVEGISSAWAVELVRPAGHDIGMAVFEVDGETVHVPAYRDAQGRILVSQDGARGDVNALESVLGEPRSVVLTQAPAGATFHSATKNLDANVVKLRHVTTTTTFTQSITTTAPILAVSR